MISKQVLFKPHYNLQNNFRRTEMSGYYALLVVISLSFASCKVTNDCAQKLAESYLEAAVDMIEKAKYAYPECVHCENNLTRGALDCSELLQMGFNKSGVYKIQPVSRVTEDKALEVYCDMQTDGGGWTLIQRRGNFQRAVDYFYRDWETYKEGFGDIEKDFWLGNDYIFALSNQKVYSVRFDLRDMDNNKRYAQYDKFWIEDEHNKYKLHVTGYAGDAGDSMIEKHNNQKFSTKDQDNDSKKDSNCADVYKGGWWYNACYYANLNGMYLKESNQTGVNWYIWKKYESMESTEIKIRPKNFRLPHSPLNIPR